MKLPRDLSGIELAKAVGRVGYRIVCQDGRVVADRAQLRVDKRRIYTDLILMGPASMYSYSSAK